MTLKHIHLPPLTNAVMVILFVLFVGVRLINLVDVINFGADAGRDFLVTWNMYTHRQVTLIGPPSQYTINGREFFFGPAPYYFILPALIVGKWDPIAVSYFLIFLNGVIFIATLILISRYIKERSTLYLFAACFIFTPAFVAYSQSYWNPYFMLPTAMLLVAFLMISKYRTKKPVWLYIVIGFLWGLGMQFHYAFLLAILVSIVWLLNSKKLSFQTVLYLFIGFVLGFLPILLFEIRNHFYNLNTLMLVFSRTNQTQDSFMWHFYYLIPLEPFMVLVGSFLFGRFVKSNLMKLALITIYCLVCLYGVVTLPRQPLSYLILKQLTTEIIQDKPKDFNILDQLTLGNRAMAMRYMLTSQGNAPMDVTAYPASKILYVYSIKPIAELVVTPVWELQSFVPLNKVSVKKVDSVLLYKIEK